MLALPVQRLAFGGYPEVALSANPRRLRGERRTHQPRQPIRR